MSLFWCLTLFAFAAFALRRLPSFVPTRTVVQVAIALLALLIVLPIGAFAADGTTVGFGGLWESTVSPVLSNVIGLVIAGVITWAGAAFTKSTGITIDARYRDSLHSAAMTGVNLALSKVGAKLDGLTLDTKSAVIAQAVEWVENSVPDALKRLGVDNVTLTHLVESKLSGLSNASATVAVTTAPSGAAVPA